MTTLFSFLESNAVFIAPLAPMIAYLYLYLRLREYREKPLDSRRSENNELGWSPFTLWAWLMSPHEHDERGRRLLPWFYLSVVALGVTLFAAFFALVGGR